MLGNMLNTLTVTPTNTFQVRHTAWMEFAFSCHFRLDNKENVSQNLPERIQISNY